MNADFGFVKELKTRDYDGTQMNLARRSRNQMCLKLKDSEPRVILSIAKNPPFGKGGERGIFAAGLCQKSPPPPFHKGG